MSRFNYIKLRLWIFTHKLIFDNFVPKNFEFSRLTILFYLQQDGSAILSQMEPPSKQFAKGVFPSFGQWTIHRRSFGHRKQNHSMSQSGFISLFNLLWKSIFDVWWEKSNYHPKGYNLWRCLSISRIYVPWRNQCGPGM